MIFCDCDYNVGVCSVGHPREVTCRTPRVCDSCPNPVAVGQPMYIQSMYDWDEAKTSRPYYLCEECGDMVLNLITIGFCFTFGESIREQWFEYLRDNEPNNPAVRKLK